MEITLRRLTIDDYDDMVRVWGVAGLPIRPQGRDGRAMLAVELSRELCASFGAFDGGRLVGLALANYDGRRGWVNRVAVDPDYRGRGLATALIQECEKFLNQIGEVVICCLIEELNSPSMELFAKNGYRCERSLTYWTKRPRPDL
ncbi:MAG: GNAT family N-acetyltransferase [Candidatus Zixiibacteriota bacterium]